MADLPPVPRIWIRSLYGFGPEEDGYIGWSQESARDRMIREWQPGDLMLIYGAGSAETDKLQRSFVLGFLDIEPRAIRDFEKSSEAAMKDKIARGWGDKWTYCMPVRRAWRTEERVSIKSVAPTTYREEAGQSIGVWGAIMTDEEVALALKIKVSEVSVFGEPPVPDTALREGSFSQFFQPSRAFPGSFGTRSSNYEDGETRLYLTRFEGNGHALLGRVHRTSGTEVIVKIGVSGDPVERIKQLNAGFPPSAVGKWGAPVMSEPFPDTKSAEAAEKAFKDLATKALTSEGGEFFWGNWDDANLLFARIPGVSRFGRR